MSSDLLSRFHFLSLEGCFELQVVPLAEDLPEAIFMLRHTAGMTPLCEGFRLEAVQEILRHESVATTQRYARFSEVMVRAQAERLWGGCGVDRKTVAERQQGG